jgi:hypothetical protein
MQDEEIVSSLWEGCFAVDDIQGKDNRQALCTLTLNYICLWDFFSKLSSPSTRATHSCMRADKSLAIHLEVLAAQCLGRFGRCSLVSA